MSAALDFESFQDSIGLIQPREGAGKDGSCASGNGLLYTGEACAVMGSDEISYFRNSFASALNACERYPGLFLRHPKCTDQESVDDYVGIGAASYFLASGHAERVLERGNRFPFLLFGVLPLRFYYANEGQSSFDLRAWLGRFPALIAHLRYAAGQPPGFIPSLVHALSIAFSPWKNEDEPILSWLMLRVAENQSGPARMAGKIFRARLVHKYMDGGMKQVFSLYLGNPNHPIAKYA